MNYKIVEESFDSFIELTDEEVDNFEVFKSLGAAKKQLRYFFKNDIMNYKKNLKRITTITKDNLHGNH